MTEQQTMLEKRVMELTKSGLVEFLFQPLTVYKGTEAVATEPKFLPVPCYLPPNSPEGYLLQLVDEAVGKANKIKEELKWRTTNTNFYEALKAKVDYYRQVGINETAFG